MKRLAFPVAALAACLAASSVSAEFRLDVGEEAYRRWQGETVFSELAVGESAYLKYSPLCEMDGALWFERDAVIDPSPSDFGTNYFATRLPNGRVSIELRPGDPDEEEQLSKDRSTIQLLVRHRDFRSGCEAQGLGRDSVFEIESIDGMTSASQVIEAYP